MNRAPLPSKNLRQAKMYSKKYQNERLPSLPKPKPAQSQSPAPRSNSPRIFLYAANIDSCLDKFDDVCRKNSMIRKNWLSAQQKLMNLKINYKSHKFLPSDDPTENYVT